MTERYGSDMSPEILRTSSSSLMHLLIDDVLFQTEKSHDSSRATLEDVEIMITFWFLFRRSATEINAS